MIYEILEKVINKNKPPTASANVGESSSEISEKIYKIQNERAAALIEEIKVKNAEIEALKSENRKLLESSNSQPSVTENQKPLSAQDVYEKFKSGRSGDIIAKLETEFKK